MTSYDHGNHEAIEELLMGRTVELVDDHTLRLDNGVVLELPDTDGGCSCGAGDYDLTVLNGTPNIITKVVFLDDPAGDDYPEGSGVYSIFVYAAHKMINLATWEGSDGNGYYGTGYTIHVREQGVTGA